MSQDRHGEPLSMTRFIGLGGKGNPLLERLLRPPAQTDLIPKKSIRSNLLDNALSIGAQ